MPDETETNEQEIGNTPDPVAPVDTVIPTVDPSEADKLKGVLIREALFAREILKNTYCDWRIIFEFTDQPTRDAVLLYYKITTGDTWRTPFEYEVSTLQILHEEFEIKVENERAISFTTSTSGQNPWDMEQLAMRKVKLGLGGLTDVNLKVITSGIRCVTATMNPGGQK